MNNWIALGVANLDEWVMKGGRVNTKLLLFTSFITGTVLMALEMIGSRVLSPYFGNSIYVWGNLIGIILLAMSIGYFIGGRIADKQADKRAPFKILYFIILLAALYILAILFFYRPLLKLLLGFGAMYGSVIATFSLFAVPMLLLSMVSPYIIRLISKHMKVGSSVGVVNAISTIGNIFGIYFATFILIPSIGTRLSIHFCFLSLLIIAVIGLYAVSKKYLALVLLSLILMTTPAYSLDENIIMEDESLYNHIVLENTSGELRLFLNTNEYTHSIRSNEYYLTGRYFDYFLLLPQMTETQNLLILGMGAGTSIDQYKFYYPEISIDAVEIDEKVIEIAEKYFGVQESDKLKIFNEDARPFLIRTDKKYDAIEIDLFQGSPYIPFYVITREFFQLTYDRLSDNGIIAVNVFTEGKDTELLPTIANTILEVYPSVFQIDSKQNIILIASKGELSLQELKEKISKSKKLNPDIQKIIDSIEFIEILKDDSTGIFTDDLAPIEKLTKKIFSE